MQMEVISMKRYLVSVLIATCVLLPTSAITADAAVLAEFKRVYDNDLRFSGFSLSSTQTVSIEARAFAYRSGGTRLMLTNAWILESDSREVVWELADSRETWKSKKIETETYEVELSAGSYEVYYSTYAYEKSRKWRFMDSGWKGGWKGGFFNDGMHGVYDDVMDEEDLDDIDDLYREFFVRVEGNGSSLDEKGVSAELKARASDAIVSLTRVGNHASETQGFELKKAMQIRVYSVGEAREDGSYDYGYVMNADTRERVWEFSYRDADHAGGSQKNRVIDDTFDAPAGRYVAVYVTDDSHAWNRWNSAPPYDPTGWGMNVSAVNASDNKHTALFDYKAEAMKNVIVATTMVGDDHFSREGVTLKKDMDVRVYALGEGVDKEMIDYGWIIDASTRKRVWEMKYRDTEHAGGGKKNRVVDEVISLPKGDYVVYYVSDDSHSYPHWNTAPPMDRESWGITLAGTGNFKKSDIAAFEDKPKTGDNLVRIVEVRDDAYVSEDFTLKKEQEIRIYAVGEGIDGRMYDYGWIEDTANGRVVWEMSYRRTDHAGGHKKNRVFSDTIVLKPGKYRVYYESDGSHSFNGWNARQPYEPENWGITISVSKK